MFRRVADCLNNKLSKRLVINSCFSTVISPKQHDTIFALSSGSGKAGIAVIRVSGPKAGEAIRKMTLAKELAPRRAIFHTIYHPINNEMLDHGLTLWFPGPRSYTGEDVAEFHVHGGSAVIKGVFDALGSLEGFRHAAKGEFTRRAFDNDKLDLTEIEGLADLINAETEAQKRLALQQAQGGLKKLYSGWRKELVQNMALTEAIIDFGEDEHLEEGIMDQGNCESLTSTADIYTRPKLTFIKVTRSTHKIAESIRNHMHDYRRGEILRNGIHVAIMGPPNAGKSSFLNYLTCREAAIVSPVPGTTRDVVEVSVNIGGYPLILGDTAGLRETTDSVESIGIERAKKRLQSADIKICVISAADLQPTMLDPVIASYIDSDTILLLNKIDLVPGEGIRDFLDAFVNVIKEKFDTVSSETPVITQSRHREHLQECLEGLERFAEQDDVVLRAEELRYAANAVGKITGQVNVEEVLDAIFERFCIGK
ncbi:7057_t:CDS:10 [Paraglomus occultum]|uniref:7057_t:CDS:1 n=1 Tax=Paraglomus occultum TaxID=144539 RepID=A0A9N8ZNE4_9GLOM|nr:7057_t:CDS:10 [Paraglomus occultum]